MSDKARVSFKRVLYEVIRGEFDSFIAQVPDESRADALAWHDEIVSATDALMARIHKAYSQAPASSKAKRWRFEEWIVANHKDIAYYLVMLFNGWEDDYLRDAILRIEFRERADSEISD